VGGSAKTASVSLVGTNGYVEINNVLVSDEMQDPSENTATLSGDWGGGEERNYKRGYYRLLTFMISLTIIKINICLGLFAACMLGTSFSGLVELADRSNLYIWIHTNVKQILQG
jgi:hypothetical protein